MGAIIIGAVIGLILLPILTDAQSGSAITKSDKLRKELSDIGLIPVPNKNRSHQ